MSGLGGGPLHPELKVALDKYNEVQTELQKLVQDNQQYESQYNETSMCQEELGEMKEDTPVFKLVGPVLVKQDPEEAKANVAKRLDFIKGELTRIQKAIEAKQKTLEEARAEAQAVNKRLTEASGATAATSDGATLD